MQTRCSAPRNALSRARVLHLLRRGFRQCMSRPAHSLLPLASRLPPSRPQEILAARVGESPPPVYDGAEGQTRAPAEPAGGLAGGQYEAEASSSVTERMQASEDSASTASTAGTAGTAGNTGSAQHSGRERTNSTPGRMSHGRSQTGKAARGELSSGQDAGQGDEERSRAPGDRGQVSVEEEEGDRKGLWGGGRGPVSARGAGCALPPAGVE